MISFTDATFSEIQLHVTELEDKVCELERFQLGIITLVNELPKPAIKKEKKKRGKAGRPKGSKNKPKEKDTEETGEVDAAASDGPFGGPAIPAADAAM